MKGNGGEKHVSLERMIEAVNSVEKALTDAEAQHIQRCPECLKLFGGLVLPPEPEE